jgi:hypothetical protein
MNGFQNWFESQTADLEDKIFAAISDDKASDFDAMLKEWVKSTNPSMSGVVLKRDHYGKNRGEGVTYFSGQLTPSYREVSAHRKSESGFSGMGLIVTPLTYRYLRSHTLEHFDGIGIDNGMFTEAGQKNFSWTKYEKMIKVALAQEKREVLGQLHFFTVPDQPFDWAATMKKFKEHASDVKRLRSWGAPVAICIQNGAVVANVPWGEIDVIFIGGNDEYKTGPDAQAITAEAKKLGKGVHMGRVNNLKRMNKGSEWGVDTADGTYVMHELAKALHEIETKNPIRPREGIVQYHERLRRLLHGTHAEKDLHVPGSKHLTEPEIIDNLVSHILDIQTKNNMGARYNAIADMVAHMKGKPLSRDAVRESDRFLPQVPHISPDDDVVQYDDAGNVKLGRDGRPLKNYKVFSQLADRPEYRPMPKGIPFDPKDMSVYNKYINKYIMRMRDAGVLPH